MTWTYGGDPSDNTRDEVRFLCGDTDSDTALVTDEEIAWALADQGSPALAAAVVCESLASKFALDVDVRNGKAYEYASQRSKQYAAMAERLRAKAGRTSASIFVGGQSVDEIEALHQDSDRRQSAFTVGMTDAFGTSSPVRTLQAEDEYDVS